MYGINNILSSVSESLTPPESLTGYGDTYIVTDLRKRSKKEPNEVKSLKSFAWKIDKKAPKTEPEPTPEPKAQESATEKNINDIVNDWVSRGYERVENVVEEIEKNPNQIFIVPLSDNKLRYIRLFEKTGNIYRFEYVNENRTTKPKLYEYQLKVIKHWLKSPQKTESAPESPKAPETEKAQESAPVESTENKPGVKLMRDVYKEPEDVLLIREIYKEKQPKTVKRVTAPQKNKFEIDKLLNETVWNMSRSESYNWSLIPPYYQMIKDADIIYNAAAKYLENHNYISIPYFQNKYSDFYYDRKGVLNDIEDIMKVNLADMSTAELRRILKKIKNRVSKINAFTDKFVNGGYFEPNPLQGLGKPTIKFEFNNNDELKAFLNDNKENLIDSYIDADIADESPLNAKKIAVNGVGNPPAGIFNCPESELICNGFVPTYQRLDDYSHLIDTAENNNVLKGYGFDDTTLNTLIDAVKHYKQVARLAAHLAADTPEQTAFNIWHWLHCNIAYNYDTPGKEEIRTPARTWSDRKSGVDCDCLSVFTAALLINLGYHPKFEIVAFANKPQFSHIYVNLDGLAIDRVLPTFNRRPMLITKTMLMDIPVYQLSGLSGINAELQGVYENALRRFAHTQDGEDLLNMRKTQILVSLQGSDYNGFRLAGLLMPYVQGIDDEGGYYFDNEEIANIAANADNDVIAAEMRGASESELGKLFKKIGKALKKAAKKVGSAVKSVAKTTAKAVTTVAKTTAKATKAAVKSAVNTVKATANVVKAGAQAATGHGSAAKATLKKAGQQVKAAVVQPVKTAVQNTKAVVKNVVVEPTKTAVKVTIVEPTKTLVKAVAKTIKIAGKIFKVILVKINPITVLMRNSLRLLIAVNFLGMATRLNVGKMSKDAAIAAGYTESAWNDAKKAYDRVIKFFTKMGGKRENIEKAIVNGAKKKALFKKDYKLNSQIIEKGSDDATLSGTGVILNGLDGLGAAVTIGSALAAVGAFFAKIWQWLCKVVPKAAKATVNVVKKVAQNDDVKKIATAAKDAAVNKAVETVTKKIGGNTTTPDILPPDTTPKKSNNWLKWALLAAAGVTVVGLAASGKKKRKKAA